MNDIRFTKFAKVFPCQKFVLHGIKLGFIISQFFGVESLLNMNVLLESFRSQLVKEVQNVWEYSQWLFIHLCGRILPPMHTFYS